MLEGEEERQQAFSRLKKKKKMPLHFWRQFEKKEENDWIGCRVEEKEKQMPIEMVLPNGWSHFK